MNAYTKQTHKYRKQTCNGYKKGDRDGGDKLRVWD